MAVPSEFIDMEEACRLLGVKPATLYAYVSRGRLRSYKQSVGRGRLYRRADLLRLLDIYPDEGLEDLVALPSSITSLAAEGVRYRGFAVAELVEDASFEAVCLLLWDGERPEEPAVEALRRQIAAVRPVRLPPGVAATQPAPLTLLRLAVDLLATQDRETEDPSAAATRRKAVRLLGIYPALLSQIQGRILASPEPQVEESGLAARLLATAGPAAPERVRALEQAMIVLADHELNASTFTARAAVSTRSDLYAAVVAALAALKGPLHGGTFLGVSRLLSDVDSPGEAEAYVRQRRAEGLWLPGFGHSVYPAGDPRALLLLRVTERALGADYPTLRVARAIEDAVVRNGGPSANADVFAGVLFQALGFAPELHPVLFAIARSAGWIAHILEQLEQNRLLRPRARYTGAAPRLWATAPLAHRHDGADFAGEDREAYWICGSD